MIPVLLVIAVALALPLIVAAARQRMLLPMAARNMNRRRGEAVLVIVGALLGTAIITSSLVVGDIIGGGVTNIASTQLGPVDITVTPADQADLPQVLDAVEEAGIAGLDGLLTIRTSTSALEAPASGTVEPHARVMELDIAAARSFGDDLAATGLTDLTESLPADGVVLHERTAATLQAGVGDVVTLHAYGAASRLVVSAVTPEVGLVGYAGAIVAPGAFDVMAAEGGAAAPPQAQLLLSLDGGVLDARESSEGVVADVRQAVAEIGGVEVDGIKATLLDDAETSGASFTQLFGTIGSFSIIAGLLLLVNLFVMLAEERKSELGMLRAIGFTRRRLTRAFAIEGALYAVVAALLGAVLGVGIGWLVAVAAGSIFGVADDGLVLGLVVEPASLAQGALTGLVVSLLTIWLTSIRIGRINVIRAIRDLPEPRIDQVKVRTLILAAVAVLAGGALSAAGYAGGTAVPLLLGVPIAAFSASPLLRRLLPERPARILVAATSLGWGLAAFPLFPSIMADVELLVFVVQGMVLTAGAVSLVTTLDTVWAAGLERLAPGGRGLSVRLGLAYPLARRFRTGMVLGMFSLVVFTMAMISSFSASLHGQSDDLTADVRGGYDLLIDSNPANPASPEVLQARDDVVTVAALSHTVAEFSIDPDEESQAWPISGMDDALLDGGAPALSSRDPAYATDEDAYRAVIADPGLAIIDDAFLQQDGNAEALHAGDAFTIIEPATGRPRQLTAAAITTSSVGNGALVSRTLTGELFGPQDVASRLYVDLADGAPADQVADDLDAALLPNGGDATTFAALVDEGLGQQTAFFGLLQAFLGLGLLVGIAGLGVVMTRAVRERRQEIGMLRAMGFPTGIVRSAFLAEAGLIAFQGTAIGAVLGLATANQLLTNSSLFGDTRIAFVLPWIGLAIVTSLPVLASLLATAWPATRAAAISPAIALRTAD